METIRHLVMALYVLLVGSGMAVAAGRVDSHDDQLAVAAGAAYDAKDWAKAAKLYEELSKSPNTPPRVWLRLGNSLRWLSRYDDALKAFDHATQFGAGMFAEYCKAGVYVAMKQPDKAFESLDKAVQQGYSDPDSLEKESDWSALRTDVRFIKLLDQAKKNQRPCAYTTENRQFDYWLGEWSVSTTQGSVPAGDSKIELILEDCVVLENWKSLNSAYSGKSYNTYNQALKQWEQYWVDNVGGSIFFHGGLRDGVMDYFTDEIPQPDGTKLMRHLQFLKLDPDTVRQFSQGSTDAGKTWKVEYDFMYKRKK